jgi:hypothetical protein
MRIKPFSAAIGAGTVLALATTIQAAQAYEVDAAHHSTSSTSAQTLRAIKEQFKAEAEFLQARAQAATTAEAWYQAQAHFFEGMTRSQIRELRHQFQTSQQSLRPDDRAGMRGVGH